MAPFRRGETVVTPEPEVVVDAGLKPGDYVFQLIAVRSGGVESKPVRVTVTIVKTT